MTAGVSFDDSAPLENSLTFWVFSHWVATPYARNCFVPQATCQFSPFFV